MDELIPSIALLVVLFLLSGFFSSAETAFTSISKFNLELDAKDGSSIASKILALIKNPDRFLTVILTGNNIVNIAATAVSTIMISKIITNSTYAMLVTTFGVTFIVLIFGEIIPKSFAAYYSYPIAKKYYIWIRFFEFIFKPLIILVTFFTSPILKFAKAPSMFHMTEEAIKHVIETNKENGIFDEDASEIITNALEFKDISASEILTPRVDIYRMKATISVVDAINNSIEAGFSRIPVIEESVDKIIGIVYLKDMFRLFYQDSEKAKKTPIRDVMRKPLRVPEDKKVSDLLIEMRKSRIQMAIVIDEYGGTDGLVTIEDILEEIVGEIRDEYDKEEDDIIEFIEEKNTLITTGRADIGDINDKLKIELPDDDFETIGGVVFNELGREVKVGDKVVTNDAEITVELIEDMNIKRLTIQKVIKTENENGETV